MMKKILLICGFLSSIFTYSQSEENILNFKLLRQYDSINISKVESGYHRLKSIPLSKNSSLSFGGSYRSQVEAFVNEQFSKEVDQSDYWFLNRLLLHAHLKVTNKFELFAELNSSLITGKDNLVTVDRDELAFNQLFARYHLNKYWNISIGRKNVRLGSGRLMDIREGPNVRLSFDMAQLQYVDSNTEITGFYAVPVQNMPGIFDNNFLDFKESVAAIYWTQHWTSNTSTDAYSLFKHEENKTWDFGTADDNRLSIGLRHLGTWKNLTYNNEFVYQTGRFGNQTISAWTASINIEREFQFGILGLKTEAISGNYNASNSLNTFDALYPRGAYFGRVARFGPSNLIDIHPYYNFRIGALDIEVDYVAFWRFSQDDGIYGPSLILEYPDTNDHRFIGHQIGSIVSLEVNTNLAFELEANTIFPGGFLSNNGLNDTLFHLVFTTEFKF